MDSRYRMFVARGELIAQPRAKLAQTCASWPHGFVKMNIEPEEFISRFNTNRAHVVPGVHTESLENYCELMDIPVDKVSRSPAEPPGGAVEPRTRSSAGNSTNSGWSFCSLSPACILDRSIPKATLPIS